MKKRFPSLLFMFYRRLILTLSSGHILGKGWLGNVLSWSFSLLVRLKEQFCYSSPRRVRATVVSVGNIVLGGAGKTPTVLWLVEALQNRGYSCAVLSRGYKGMCSGKKTPTIVDANVHSATYVGDEPLLMAEKLPPRSVWVHKDRRLSAVQAAEFFDILLLDDGLQYRKLHKDVEIAVVNGQDPLGSSAFFPKGRLRDFPDRLRNVDAIVVNGSCNLEHRNLLKKSSSAKQIFVEPRIASVVWIHKGEHVAHKKLQGFPAGVFCGLGFPQGFLNMLRNAGVKILGTYVLPDHVGITKKELYYFCRKIALCQGQGVLCTEKDSVKLHNLFDETDLLPIGKVCMNLQVEESQASFLLDTIDQIHKNRGDE
ncbi:tetraacyldisaccharide 4'-kinase [Chlamydia sp. 17-3921]|uniref:tetraacyldisaccharide 4'-kinase n=1 Tax=Chlamydia sp. 17-3921 TaxID=2675798 RepID=UPI001919F916|nr:tetraacyldisaccharide 4'-kinase [Chlamydia sp. 17-3921]